MEEQTWRPGTSSGSYEDFRQRLAGAISGKDENSNTPLVMVEELRVFITYAHESQEHAERVHALCNQLRSDGVNAWTDQFEPSSPAAGWTRWIQEQITSSKYVIIVCTERYKKAFEGESKALERDTLIPFEGILIRQCIAEGDSHRFIPVLFESEPISSVPLSLRGQALFHLPLDYEWLLRRLTNQPLYLAGTGLELKREASNAELCLDVDLYATTLAAVLAEAQGELCFAVFAPWGRGKTTLARRLCEVLKSRHNAPRYSVVWYNAWKYRSPPEIWAHFYETLADGLRADGWLAAKGRQIRMNLSKHGVAAITVSLTILALGIVPLSFKIGVLLDAATVMLGIFGLFMSVWILFAVHRTGKIVRSVWSRYGALHSHTERLGLQSAIGDDVRALLKGWIWTPHSESRTEPPDARISRLDLAGLGLSVGAVAISLYLPLRSLDTDSAILAWIMPATWVVFWGAMAAIASAGSSTDRLLLVIDDLDRCPPAQILDVLESIKLLAEEPDVSQRMQMIVLIDEYVLSKAISDRFRNILTEEGGRAERRIVREHIEKLFLGWIRLGPLSRLDIENLIRRLYVQPTEFRPAQDGPASALTAFPSGSPRAVPMLVNEDRASRHEGPVRLTDEEREAILVESFRLLEHHASHRVGPRMIRGIVFRFQLARMLVAASGLTMKPVEVVRRIVSPYFDESEPAQESDGSNPARQAVERILQQVV